MSPESGSSPCHPGKALVLTGLDSEQRCPDCSPDTCHSQARPLAVSAPPRGPSLPTSGLLRPPGCAADPPRPRSRQGPLGFQPLPGTAKGRPGRFFPQVVRGVPGRTGLAHGPRRRRSPKDHCPSGFPRPGLVPRPHQPGVAGSTREACFMSSFTPISHRQG